MRKIPSIKELQELGFRDDDPKGQVWCLELPGCKRSGAWNRITVDYNDHRIMLDTVSDNGDWSMPYDLPYSINMKMFLKSIGAIK